MSKESKKELEIQKRLDIKYKVESEELIVFGDYILPTFANNEYEKPVYLGVADLSHTDYADHTYEAILSKSLRQKKFPEVALMSINYGSPDLDAGGSHWVTLILRKKPIIYYTDPNQYEALVIDTSCDNPKMNEILTKTERVLQTLDYALVEKETLGLDWQDDNSSSCGFWSMEICTQVAMLFNHYQSVSSGLSDIFERGFEITFEGIKPSKYIEIKKKFFAEMIVFINDIETADPSVIKSHALELLQSNFEEISEAPSNSESSHSKDTTSFHSAAGAGSASGSSEVDSSSAAAVKKPLYARSKASSGNDSAAEAGSGSSSSAKILHDAKLHVLYDLISKVYKVNLKTSKKEALIKQNKLFILIKEHFSEDANDLNNLETYKAAYSNKYSVTYNYLSERSSRIDLTATAEQIFSEFEQLLGDYELGTEGVQDFGISGSADFGDDSGY